MKTHDQPRQATRQRYFSSMFSQLLALFSRADFQRLVIEHTAERGAKGFDCWTRFEEKMP